MNRPLTLRAWLARYLPVFMGVVFMGCFSLAASVSLVGNAFFSDVPLHKRAITSWLACLALGFFVVQVNVLILLGRRAGVPVMGGYFVCCLAVILLSVGGTAATWLSVLSLLWPLLGLLLLNSRRHREMRQGIAVRKAGR